MTVGFVLLFFWRFQRWSITRLNYYEVYYESSVMAGFISLRDLNDSRFCSFVRLRDYSLVLFCYEISMMVFFFRYEFSKTVGFAGSCDFNDGWFYLVMRSRWSFLFLCSFTRFQRQLVLFCYEISMMVGFVRL